MDPIAFAMMKLVSGTDNHAKFFKTPPEELMNSKTRIGLHAILVPWLAMTTGPLLSRVCRDC